MTSRTSLPQLGGHDRKEAKSGGSVIACALPPSRSRRRKPDGAYEMRLAAHMHARCRVSIDDSNRKT
ncbi:hypothetical protein EIQ25_07825 [Xanthomonas campestris pv. campestris]